MSIIRTTRLKNLTTGETWTLTLEADYDMKRPYRLLVTAPDLGVYMRSIRNASLEPLIEAEARLWRSLVTDGFDNEAPL